MFLLTFSPFDKIETNRPGNRIKAEGEAVIIPPILCRLVLSKGIKRQNKKKKRISKKQSNYIMHVSSL